MNKLMSKVESQDMDDIYLDDTENLDIEKVYFGYVFSDEQEPYFISGDTSEIEISIWGNDGIGAATFNQYEMNIGETEGFDKFAACPGFLSYQDGAWVFDAHMDHLIDWITDEDLSEWENGEELSISNIKKNVFEYIEKNKSKMIETLSAMGIKANI